MKYFRRDIIKNGLLGVIGVFPFGGRAMELVNKEQLNKQVKFAYEVKQRNWVGDGFYVHGLLRPSKELINYISPFILMDYASPKMFSKTEMQRGVGEHPHRGFETVTVAYQGEIEHLDSSGGGGVIKEGDVQWMTAGKGIVHQEYHSKKFSKEGGLLEMVQLWVNLPKKYKMTEPKYQEIKNLNIPNIKIGDKAALRIISGEFAGSNGPASTFTPINMFDIRGQVKENISLPIKEGTNTILLIMKGNIEIEGNSFSEQNVLIFEREGRELNFTISEDFKGLLLNGEPIDEPVVAHGPFVMNTEQEIIEAIDDYRNGKMGKI
ncbi:MAG: pirin family protein [Oligoflexales bacterium]